MKINWTNNFLITLKNSKTVQKHPLAIKNLKPVDITASKSLEEALKCLDVVIKSQGEQTINRVKQIEEESKNKSKDED